MKLTHHDFELLTRLDVSIGQADSKSRHLATTASSRLRRDIAVKAFGVWFATRRFQ